MYFVNIYSFRVRGNDTGKSAEDERDDWCKVSGAHVISIRVECAMRLNFYRQYLMAAVLDVNQMHACDGVLSLVGHLYE